MITPIREPRNMASSADLGWRRRGEREGSRNSRECLHSDEHLLAHIGVKKLHRDRAAVFILIWNILVFRLGRIGS